MVNIGIFKIQDGNLVPLALGTFHEPKQMLHGSFSAAAHQAH